MHRAPNLAQPAHQARPGARARGRVASAGRRIVGAASAVSWAQAPCRSAMCCVPGCRVLGCCALYRNTMPCLKQPSDHNTPRCIAIQSLVASPCWSQYNLIVLLYKLSPASLLYCNTIASPSNYIAIHLPPRPATSLSQYTLLYCDTISLNQTSHLLQYTQLYCNTNSSLPSQHY